jgi:hypothetical protein
MRTDLQDAVSTHAYAGFSRSARTRPIEEDEPLVVMVK